MVDTDTYLSKLKRDGHAAKLDDLGDLLLHSLSDILCGGSNNRPLTPATPSMHVNRSIVISVFSVLLVSLNVT